MAQIFRAEMMKQIGENIKINKTFQRNVFNESVHPYFQEQKKELIKDFEDSEITKEIEGGPDEENISGTMGDYGNLYSFIGFENGTNPIQEVRDYLDQNITLGSLAEVKVTGEKITLTYPNLAIPTDKEIDRSFPVPDGYTSKGWIRSIEEGFSNLKEYIYKNSPNKKDSHMDKYFEESRSGTGLQIKRNSGRIFSPQNYLISFIKKFREKFRKFSI